LPDCRVEHVRIAFEFCVMSHIGTRRVRLILSIGFYISEVQMLGTKLLNHVVNFALNTPNFIKVTLLHLELFYLILVHGSLVQKKLSSLLIKVSQ
jgi:hypothetical protein